MWDAFKDIIFQIIQAFYNFCGDWGLAIVLVTIIFRILISPLMHKQIKSSFHMQKMQPLMTEIQTKYKDNPQRQQEEMQKLYAESKFNPLAGCLPMLLQMPIFMALFQVLQEMGGRTQGSTYEFYNLIPSLITKPSEAFSQGIGAFIPYLILMLVFAGATFLPMLLQQRNNKGPQQKQTLIMAAVMSVFMLWIGWGAPAGVLLFWGMSGLVGVTQQQLTTFVLKKEDAKVAAETIDIEPVHVDVTRKAKKPRPAKKG
ncbi:MAG: YidC/Oxa1 family membrane protein insertase [Raoultibacter sp.]